MTTDEMYADLGSCLSAEGNCKEIQTRIDWREKAIQMRENAMMICPDGQVAFCDARARGCGFGHPYHKVEYVCMSEEIVQDMLSLY